MQRALLLLALAGCGGTSPRVWTTAYRTLPAGVDRALYVDLTTLRGTRTEAWVFRRAADIMALADDAGAAMRKECGLDPSGAELVMAAVPYGQPVLFVRIPGGGEQEIQRCAAKLLHASARRDGRVIVFEDGEGPIGELLWVTPEVFAFMLGTPDRPTLLKLAGGAGGLDRDLKFNEGLVSIDYGAPVWGVFVPPEGSDARGTVSFNAGRSGRRADVTVRVPAGNVLRAWGMAQRIRQMLAPPAYDFAAATAEPEGNDVVVHIVLDEDQIDRALERLSSSW